MDLPEGGVPLRDLVIQFSHAPLVASSETIPELREVLPLLERARHGVEFFGMEAQAQEHWHRIKARQGLARFGAFCEFLSDLARCTDFRLLSSTQLQSEDNDTQLDQINAIVSRITDHLADPLSAADLAQELGMTESRFALLPPRHGQYLHRLCEPGAREPRVPAADGDRALHHAHCL